MPVIFINASNWLQQKNAINPLVYSGLGQVFLDLSIQKACSPSTWQDKLGAFSFCLVDEQVQEFVLVRDHVGCAPIYYYFDEHCLIVGSSLPDVIRHLPISTDLNTSELITTLTGSQQYSDATFYQHVYRVEPGHIVHFSSSKRIKKIPFWVLDPKVDDLSYANEKDYLQAFDSLLHESVHFNCQNAQSLGGELSGGLDSSAILVTAHQQGFRYPLFMHVANPGSKEVDDRRLAEALLQHIQHDNAYFINAGTFDLIQSLEFCAMLFAGPAPYIFFMMAQNVHQAVVSQGCTVLLSGAGGDECVSSHASLHDSLPNMLRQTSFKRAWHELLMDYQAQGKAAPSLLRRAERLLKYSHPHAFDLLGKMASISHALRDFFQSKAGAGLINKNKFYHSLRESEWDRLQGPRSHGLRMRVEYSSVLAHAMGFEYRYPLLYPKLVEFCFRLPLFYKRRDGMGRYMIRQYLKTQTPSILHTKLQKQGGIIPATLDQSYQYLSSGRFDKAFSDLPYLHLAKQDNPHQVLSASMLTYMLKYYSESM